jgi:hypothetical protein
VIGHVRARAYLERGLPTATLLVGPASVGKWTLANHLADHHQVRSIDRWQVPHGLTIDTVRLVTAYAARAPLGAFKLIQVRLDSSSSQALNALLKTLEEPPPRVKFLLTSSGSTMPTVASRCTVFELGMLGAGELEQIYRTQGYPASKAKRAADFARGQVQRGYGFEVSSPQRDQVAVVIKALSTGDRGLFGSVFKHWDQRSTELLSTFFTECLTTRWSAFTEADACGLHHDRTRLWAMVSALSKLPAARPRLGVRAALEPFLTHR